MAVAKGCSHILGLGFQKSAFAVASRYVPVFSHLLSGVADFLFISYIPLSHVDSKVLATLYDPDKLPRQPRGNLAGPSHLVGEHKSARTSLQHSRRSVRGGLKPGTIKTLEEQPPGEEGVESDIDSPQYKCQKTVPGE